MRRSDLSGSSSRHPHQRIVQDHANRLLTLLEQEHHRKRMALEPNRAVQTDQLQVISGSLDLIVLQDRCLHWIHLRDDESMWLRIPPGGSHGAVNRSARPAVVVNAVLRHGASDLRDHQPRAIPRALAQMWSDLQAA